MSDFDQLMWVSISYVLGSVILWLSYFLMYQVHKRNYLKQFSITWGLLVIAYITLLTYYITEVIGYMTLFLLILVCAGFMFHIGALAMVEKPHTARAKKIKILWFSIVVFTLFFAFPPIVYGLIFYGSFGIYLLCAGYVFLLTRERQYQIVASFMALLGVANISYVFIYNFPFFMPLGYAMISLLGFFIGAGIIALHLQDIQVEQQALRSHLLFLRYQDDLTNVYNRNFLDKALKELDVASCLPLGLVLIDLNELKIINDTYGHRRGDILLSQVASNIRQIIHTKDILLRYGGDEFLILIPNTNLTALNEVKAAILTQCHASQIADKPISIAIGSALRTSLEQSFNDIFDTAEEEMYRHKHSLHDKGKS